MTHTAGISAEAVAGLVERLNGIYRVPITDGLGPAGGDEPDNASEFVRTFPTPPIQKEAASALTTLATEVEALRRERDEARAKLFPYADETEISGMSWSGFYLIGNKRSIKELERIENRSAQLETYHRAYEERITVEKSRADSLAAELAQCREALTKRAEWHKCSCPEPCDDYNVFPGGCAGRYREDYLAMLPPERNQP